MRLWAHPSRNSVMSSRKYMCFPRWWNFTGECGSCMFYRAGLTPFVMHRRCQRSNLVVHPRWPSLGEFVPTVGLPDGSRPGCWSWLCRPTFYGIPASPFEPPSMEISSSSHYSWRHLLFKPPPLISAASLELLVFRVLLIVLWAW